MAENKLLFSNNLDIRKKKILNHPQYAPVKTHKKLSFRQFHNNGDKVNEDDVTLYLYLVQSALNL